MAGTIKKLSFWHKFLGLSGAALIAWAALTTIDLVGPFIERLIAYNIFDFEAEWPKWQKTLNHLYIYALFGIPISLIVSISLGMPIWSIAERHGLHKHAHAMKVGILVGLLIGTGGILLSTALGLRTALDDASTYNAYRWGWQVIRDGLPTMLGWTLQFLDLLLKGTVGAIAGMMAWSIAFGLDGRIANPTSTDEDR